MRHALLRKYRKYVQLAFINFKYKSIRYYFITENRNSFYFNRENKAVTFNPNIFKKITPRLFQ